MRRGRRGTSSYGTEQVRWVGKELSNRLNASSGTQDAREEERTRVPGGNG